jgi:hypothetical protein
MNPPLRSLPFTINGFGAKIIFASIDTSPAAGQHFASSATIERLERLERASVLYGRAIASLSKCLFKREKASANP